MPHTHLRNCYGDCNALEHCYVDAVSAFWNRRILVFGARTIFFGFALIFLNISNRFFWRRFDRCGRLDRSRCSKTVENSLAFALYLPNEIDAFSFSGPEQFSSGLRWFCLNISNRFFWRRFDRCGRLDRSRCYKTIENSSTSVCIVLAFLAY